MKYDEDILKETGHDSITKSTIFSFKGAITQKLGNPDLQFLHLACLLMLVNICVKFHEDSFNSSKLQSRHD